MTIDIVSSEDAKRHIVFVSSMAWGHARPICSLTARLAQTRPMVATLFVPKYIHHRVDTELARNFDADKVHLRSRIRLIALPCGEGAPDSAAYYAAFMEAYKQLIAEEPLSCAHTGDAAGSVRSPDAVIIDIFADAGIKAARLDTRKKVPAYCYVPASSSAVYRIIYLWGDLLDRGNVRAMIEQDAKESGKSTEEYAAEYFASITGKALSIPGLPSLYDHEMNPQEVTVNIDARKGMINVDILETLNTCSGVIVSSPVCIDTHESLTGMRAHFAQTGRSFYTIGPLLPVRDATHAVQGEKTLSPDAARIAAFMEAREARSVVFMSFGSMFWPKDPSKVWLFLDVMVEMGIYFIFSHGPKDAHVPDDVAERVHASGYGVITSWAPQQSILAHPATAWFVTHSGFGSVIESMNAGVPMICWPHRAEQPINALHLTHNLDIAYELVQIRTGEHAQKPIRSRNDLVPSGTPDAVREEARKVLSDAFGADGERKRRNALRLRERIAEAWAEEEGEGGMGSSKRNLDAFLDEMGV